MLTFLVARALAVPEDRVPAQLPDRPFAVSVLGGGWEQVVPLAASWPVPAAGGGFHDVAPLSLGAVSVHAGALHHHGHGEWYVTFPVWSQPGTLPTPDGPREATWSYNVVTGLRAYPLALDAGTVRPSLGLEWAGAALAISDVEDPAANPGAAWRPSLGPTAGVAWRTPWHVAADVHAVADFSSLSVYGPEERLLDLTSVRVVGQLKFLFDVTPQLGPVEWHEREVRRIEALQAAHAISGPGVGLGPGGRVFRYRTVLPPDRPELYPAFGELPYFHASLDWYSWPVDAAIRASYRPLWGGVEAYGTDLSRTQHGVFLEAFKFFDPDLYGFVPFLGGGGGITYVSQSAEGLAGADVQAWVPAPTVVFGWDIRFSPTAWAILRTALRWIPYGRFGPDRAYDIGGLEYDWIQVVVYPERVGARSRLR